MNSTPLDYWSSTSFLPHNSLSLNSSNPAESLLANNRTLLSLKFDGPCFRWQQPQHVLFQLANICFCISYLAPNGKVGIIFMHSLLIPGFMLFSTWAWNVICAPDIFSWNFCFMLLNMGQTLYLLYTMRKVKFPVELEDIYQSMFQPLRVYLTHSVLMGQFECRAVYISNIHNILRHFKAKTPDDDNVEDTMSNNNPLHLENKRYERSYNSNAKPGNISQPSIRLTIPPTALTVSRLLFKKLVSVEYAQVMSLHAGEAYAMQDLTKTDRLGLLISGKVNVITDHHFLHHINPKEFLDSPEFESSRSGVEEKFKVSIIAAAPCRYIFWHRQNLEYLLIKEGYLAIVLSLLLSRDITTKLYAMNDKIVTEKGSHLDIRLPSITGSMTSHPTTQDGGEPRSPFRGNRSPHNCIGYHAKDMYRDCEGDDSVFDSKEKFIGGIPTANNITGRKIHISE